MRLPTGLRTRFGLDPLRFVPLRGGNAHTIFRQDDLVVRLERLRADELEWQFALLEFLGPRVPEVVQPLAHESGVSIWPYVPGRLARRNDRDDALAAADLLRRLHVVGRDWAGGQRPGATGTAGAGARGPVHGDFWRGNILMRRRAVAGLVDWEESCVDLLEYELANAVWEFCKSKRTHDFDRDLAREVLAAAGSSRSPEELVPLILVRRRLELSTPDAAYRRHTERAITNLSLSVSDT